MLEKSQLRTLIFLLEEGEIENDDNDDDLDLDDDDDHDDDGNYLASFIGINDAVIGSHQRDNFYILDIV